MEPEVVEALKRYREGELTEKETIKLFQRLIDNGYAWKLGYGILANNLIDKGLCKFDRKERVKW